MKHSKKSEKNSFGKKCYQVIQGQESPFSFSTNPIIFNEYLGKTYNWEFQNRKNGRWFRCSDKAIKWFNGKMMRMELAIDITESKNNELKLKESETKFRAMAENTSDGLITIDENEKISFVSPSYTKLFGYSPAEMLKESIEDRMKSIHPDDTKYLREAHLNNIIYKRGNATYEYRLKHRMDITFGEKTMQHTIIIQKGNLKHVI